MGHAGVGWAMQGWVGHVGVGWGGSCRAGVGHAGLGCVTEGGSVMVI